MSENEPETPAAEIACESATSVPSSSSPVAVVSSADNNDTVQVTTASDNDTVQVTTASDNAVTKPPGLAATSQVTLTSPLPSIVSSLRTSALTTVKRTRQIVSEKLGRGSKTVDPELQARIDSLVAVQKRYVNVLQLARSFNAHFSGLVACQQALATEFADLSQKMPELHNEFAYNAETQKALFRNGEALLNAVNFFVATVNTLCSKTIEDTLLTARQYEKARLEYDAYRSDVESSGASKSPELQQAYEQYKAKFDQLRRVLDIKLKFLDENKVKVMHQQLLLFHNAIAAYFAGNQKALEDTIGQFNIKLKSPNATIPSWLESQD